MIVYLDLVIISTIIVNFAFIKLISVIFNEKINIIRVIIGLILCIISLFLFIMPLEIYNLRYFVGIIIGSISFKYYDIRNFIIKITTFYLLNLSFIGTLVVFNIHSVLIMFIALGFIIVLYIIENYKNKINKYYQVIINNKKYKAILDTGNEAYYQNVPVVFINSKHFNDDFKEIGMLTITSVANVDIVKIYKGPVLKINNKEIEVVYSFSNTLQYDLILHNEIGGII